MDWTREREREAERWRESLRQERLKNFAKTLAEGRDVRVDPNMVRFCSSVCLENLRQHSLTRKVRMGRSDRTADWIHSVFERLSGLTPDSELAGLAALAVTVLSNVMCYGPSADDAKDALHRVFTKDEVLKVWNWTDEVLKRCVMNVHDKDELVGEVRRAERQLSARLTQLKNAMLIGGQTSPRALKAWVNGAALHVQILIHLVRLGGVRTCDPVRMLLGVYGCDLDALFREHREAVASKCCRKTAREFGYEKIYLVDEDDTSHLIDEDPGYPEYFDAYYDRRYGQQQREIHQHFSEVRESLQTLVPQGGSPNGP